MAATRPGRLSQPCYEQVADLTTAARDSRVVAVVGTWDG